MSESSHFWSVLLGAISAVAGSFGAIWIQAKLARRTRMDERIAEKKVEANDQAYYKIKIIDSMLVQAETEDVRKQIQKDEQWFFENRLFLPGRFPDKWLSIKAGLEKAIRLQHNLPNTVNECAQLDADLRNLAEEAIQEIYKEMRLSRLEAKMPCGAESQQAQFIVGWHRCFQKYGLFISPLVAVFLFWLGGQSERRNLRLEQDRYNNQVVLSLQNELSQNYSNINNIRDILTKDLDELKESRVTIMPLVNFQFTAWEHARFGRADFLYRADTKDFMKLKNSYFMLHILESRIHNREQYRLLHEGLLNFPGRMETLDRDILSILDGVQESIRQSQEYLDQIHAWKVTGDSFSVDKGLVVEVEQDAIKK